MTFRKPQLIPLLFIIGATALLCTLGGWQLQRLAWKEGLIATITQAQAEPALVSLPRDMNGLDYRKISLGGHFIKDKELRMVAQPRGGQPGFSQVMPFVLSDGRVILVNRGWVLAHWEDKQALPTKVEGVIRPMRPKRTFTPDNQPENNLWFFEDAETMGKAVDKQLVPMIIEATGERKKDVYPVPSDGKISLRNDHLGYAIIWFSLAVIGLVMFVFYHRESEKHT